MDLSPVPVTCSSPPSSPQTGFPISLTTAFKTPTNNLFHQIAPCKPKSACGALTFQKRMLQCRQKCSVSPYCSLAG